MAYTAESLKKALFASHFVTLPLKNANSNSSETIVSKETTSKIDNHQQNGEASEADLTKGSKQSVSGKASSKSKNNNPATSVAKRNNSVIKKEKTDKSLLCKEMSSDLQEPVQCSPDLNETDVVELSLDSLLNSLENENDVDLLSKNTLIVAHKCINKESFTEFQDHKTFNIILKLLADSHNPVKLVLCYTFLLGSVSKNSLSITEIKLVEESLLLVLKYITVPKYENGTYGSVETNCMGTLSDDQQKIAHELCGKMFSEKIDAENINISTLCCFTLKNLSVQAKEYHNIGISYAFDPETFNYIFGMMEKATQEVLAEDSSTSKETNMFTFTSTHTISHCLKVLEYAFYTNPDDQINSLHRDNISFPHCLTRLLGWCISALFQDNELKDANSLPFDSLPQLYLSILISILKVLSSLMHNADSFAKIGNVKGLMEKVMICTLKMYFGPDDHHFEVLLLCLELMINLYLTDQNTFLRLCLKKFKVGRCEELLSIEALIKILSNNLEKIKQVQDIEGLEDKPSNEQNDSDDDEDDSDRQAADDSQMQLVLKAADKDMELSTLCSYICVLLVFFIDTKDSFKEFIRERLPSETTTDAISESRRVLQFASLTGGMSKCGILMLQHSIRVLQSMHE